MEFNELKRLVIKMSQSEQFQIASDKLQDIVFNLKKEDFIPLVTEIGAIPEDIAHDSSEEKLYSKISDIILAKCFVELDFEAAVYRERSNCADVLIKSKYHNYSLVADAKSFRLSRTAKNQKDFKVESMVDWKCGNDYSVLCCPYFQYPKNKSQIYGQAIKGNVTLFSWEYFSLLLKNNIKESSNVNLSVLWNFSKEMSSTASSDGINACFLAKQNDFIRRLLNCSQEEFNCCFENFKNNIINRANSEINYWENKILQINELSKEQAIELLIKSLKLNEKINSIDSCIKQLRNANEY